MKNDLDADGNQHVLRHSYGSLGTRGNDFYELARVSNPDESKMDHQQELRPPLEGSNNTMNPCDIDIEAPSERHSDQLHQEGAVSFFGNNLIKESGSGLRKDSFDGDLMLQSLQMMILSQIENAKSPPTAFYFDKKSEGISEHKESEISVTNEFVKPDDSSIQQSILISLGGGCTEYFLTFNVLVYLSAQDLCKLSLVSKYFAAICKSNHLWHLAYKRDFIADVAFNQWNQGTMCAPPRERHSKRSNWIEYSMVGSDIRNSEKPMFTRANYLERYSDHSMRVLRGKENKQQLGRDVVRLEKMDMIEQILDFIQVRTLAPVGMLSIFLSVVLFCQWEDGLNIPLWSCGIPVGFSAVYLMIALYVIFKVHKRQYAMDHILRGFWSNMSGPLVYFYQEAMNESSRLFYLVQGIIAMMIVQIGLVVIKLTSAVPDSFDNQLSWGIVFIPIWLLFFLFMVSPCTKFRLSIGTYFFIFFVFWVPLFILFACLTQKLDSERYLRMAHILIPFYIIEGTVMLASLIFLITGIVSYRRGYLERIDDYVAIFFLSWITLSPLVTFQSLLVVRDDNQIAHRASFPSATEVATPLLIMQGWMTLVVTYACLTYKTGFENVRTSRLQDSAGLRIIYKV